MKQYHFPLKIKQLIAQAQAGKQKLVLVTGVFDLLHQEHIKFLNKAKEAGDILLVAVETDERVRAIKGSKRPINDEQTRIDNLRKVGLADGVFLLPERFDQPDEHRAFIRKVKPDILAVSSHSPYLQAKRKIVKRIGGQLRIVHQYNPDISTTKLIKEQTK